MRQVWADEDGNPVAGSKIGWLDPLILVIGLVEAVTRAFLSFFTSWRVLLMQHENADAEWHNALEVAAVELETVTVGDGDDEDEEEDDDG